MKVLRKTKVHLCASEQMLSDLLDEFDDKCEGTMCDECKIVRSNKILSRNECRARFIYERTRITVK